MHSLYNQVAGRSVERLAALSDGIFAVAMTLLVLDLRVPAAEAIHSERDLWHALVVLSPRILIFLMSVMTNGIFWVGQQTQLNQFARADRNLAWIHIAFLCAVSLTPFSTSLLAEFIHYRLALLVYWFNIVLLGAALYWSWHYATRTRLLAETARHTPTAAACAAASGSQARGSQHGHAGNRGPPAGAGRAPSLAHRGNGSDTYIPCAVQLEPAAPASAGLQSAAPDGTPSGSDAARYIHDCLLARVLLPFR